jgi:hypothetical protein
MPKDEIEKQIRLLIAIACGHPRGSFKRQRNLTKIIQIVQESGQFKKISSPDYEDALQLTWIHLCRNLCHQYDPEKGSLITWLNGYLKWRILDIQQPKPTVPIEDAQDFPAQPDIPPLLEDIKNWVETDPDGQLRRIHIRNHPEITAQMLILRRLPPETSWQDLSTEFGISLSTLSNFYQNKCLPLLRNFGKSEGYLE